MTASLRAASLLLAAILPTLAVSACVSPGLGDYERQKPAEPGYAGPTVMFLGTSTLVFEYGDVRIATDGFFTHPGALKFLFGEIGSDAAEVARVRDEAGIDHLDAVIAVHSHYDHAMDAPVLGQQTGAILVGSPSTGMIADGSGFDMNWFRTFYPEKGYTSLRPDAFPPFEITSALSVHGPTPSWTNAEGSITEKLVPPAPYRKYKEGGSYSVFLTINTGAQSYTALVHASAGYVPGALDHHDADVVYLGITPLGDMDESERKNYWMNVVCAVHARRVIPIRWDDLFATLHKDVELKPMYRKRFTAPTLLMARGFAHDAR